MSDRLKQHEQERTQEILNQEPLVDPLFLRFRQPFKLIQALRHMKPEEVQRFITRGRHAVTFKYIPRLWDIQLLENICKVYGNIQKIGLNSRTRWAKVVFYNEKAAQCCEEALFEQIANEEGRNVCIRRVYDF